MAGPIFQLTAFELTSILRAKDAFVMGQRLTDLAGKYGVAESVLWDAVWASGTIGGHTAKTAAARAGAQSMARGAARRMGEVGARNVARHAAGHAARVAGAEAVGGFGAALGTVGTVLGVGLLAGVLAVGAYAAHRIYTTSQGRTEQVDLYSPQSIFGDGVDKHGNDIHGASGVAGTGLGSLAGELSGPPTIDHGPTTEWDPSPFTSDDSSSMSDLEDR